MLLKVYSQLLLLVTASSPDSKKKLQGILKGKKQFEETEKVSAAEMLESKDWELGTTRINELRALVRTQNAENRRAVPAESREI